MDASTFKQRFLPCSRRMYAVAWRLTGNAQSAEDLVQETFLKLWTMRDRLGDIGNADAYCATAVRNIFCDRHRTKRIETEDTPAEGLRAQADGDVAELTETAEESEMVMALIGRLPEQQRRIITMRDVDGMGYDEIAAGTGLSAVNVRVVLSRARKQIREQFNKIRNYGCK